MPRKTNRTIQPRPLMRENLLTMVRGSTGSHMFRKMYFRIGGRTVEVLRDGDLSCALFVSSILRIFSLIREPHTTIRGTVKDMKRSGWKAARKPAPGSIILWGPKYFRASRETHKHIGFYVGHGKAISNNSKKKSPQLTRWDFRLVEAVFAHPKLK